MSCVRHNDSNVTCNAKAKGEVSSVSLLPKLCNQNQSYRTLQERISSWNPLFQRHFLRQNVPSLMALLGLVHAQSNTNLAKSCRNSLDFVKNKQLDTCQPLRFFDKQHPVCVYENES